MRRLTVILLLLTGTMEIKCQDKINNAKPKNSITIEGATAVYIGMVALNWERTLVLKDIYRVILNTGFGGWYLVPVPRQYSGISIPLSFNLLEGKGNNHFEADLGVRYTFYNKESDEDRSPFFPIINFGYRYQRPDGTGLIFRSFIGYSGIGIGVGKAF